MAGTCGAFGSPGGLCSALVGMAPEPQGLARCIEIGREKRRFMPYSPAFWQKMAEFGTILHKKRGFKMGPLSNTRLMVGRSTASTSFRLSKRSPPLHRHLDNNPF